MFKGIRCYVQNDCYESLEAIIPGPKETPYEEIQFKIAMEFDSHYPFRPPSAKFITPVYHPNIDTGNSKSSYIKKCFFFYFLCFSCFLPHRVKIIILQSKKKNIFAIY